MASKSGVIFALHDSRCTLEKVPETKEENVEPRSHHLRGSVPRVEDIPVERP